jgi:uncharacterized membrane protein YagU involved in acid resistance
MTATLPSADRERLLRAIPTLTAVSGTVDILYAMGMGLTRGAAPERVLQSVASGLLGAEAYTGGTATAALGLVLHFILMGLMASVFVIAATRLAWLTARPALAGIAYGLVTSATMNLVVIPLSAIGHLPNFTPRAIASTLFAHIVLVGLPFAFMTRRLLGKNRG